MQNLAELIIRAAAFTVGVYLIARTLLSAIRTFILPRSVRDRVSAFYFVPWRKAFTWRANRTKTYEDRDAVMAMFAPLSLILIPVYWLLLVGFGYTLIYMALGIDSFYAAVVHSGSTLTTLGFDRREGYAMMLATFSESAISLILVAILISYLPTMYGAFSRREAAVTLLEVRAGTPPSAVEMLGRAHRIRGLDYLTEVWEQWEQWFAELEESHTSLAALVFFRSPEPQHSWLTAAGTVLDCASLYASTLNVPRNPPAELCIRSGFLALRAIADFYRLRYDPDPAPTDRISVTRQEFDEAYDRLLEYGVPLKPDRDQCWRDYAGWRVNYDAVLIQLAALTMAPYAPWISDRSIPRIRREEGK
jgi:hypothetical protein